METKTVNLKLASSKDKKPTIRVSELKAQGVNLLITFENKGKVFASNFHLSRNSQTYYANYWLKEWPLPKIRQPLKINVLNISVV